MKKSQINLTREAEFEVTIKSGLVWHFTMGSCLPGGSVSAMEGAQGQGTGAILARSGPRCSLGDAVALLNVERRSGSAKVEVMGSSAPSLWQSCCCPCIDFTLKGHVKKHMNSF